MLQKLAAVPRIQRTNCIRSVAKGDYVFRMMTNRMRLANFPKGTRSIRRTEHASIYAEECLCRRHWRCRSPYHLEPPTVTPTRLSRSQRWRRFISVRPSCRIIFRLCFSSRCARSELWCKPNVSLIIHSLSGKPEVQVSKS